MFVQGKLYRRRDLHHQHGGQSQGGISTPADQNFIFVFTGEQGEQYGYSDSWTDDGIFFYTGEGQRGDMQFVRGNKAVRDHFKDGKELYLFSYGQKRGWIRYVGQMVCTGFHFQIAPDFEGNARRAIAFELTPIEEFLRGSLTQEEEDLSQDSLGELRRKALLSSAKGKNASERKSLVRLRSQAIRLYILKRADGSCEGCKRPAPFRRQNGEPYLEAHHIRRLSDGGPDDPRWVVALCPNCHRRAHYSEDSIEFNRELGNVVERLEEKYR